MLVFDPAARATAQEMLSHPWLRNDFNAAAFYAHEATEDRLAAAELADEEAAHGERVAHDDELDRTLNSDYEALLKRLQADDQSGVHTVTEAEIAAMEERIRQLQVDDSEIDRYFGLADSSYTSATAADGVETAVDAEFSVKDA